MIDEHKDESRWHTHSAKIRVSRGDPLLNELIALKRENDELLEANFYGKLSFWYPPGHFDYLPKENARE